MKGSGSSTNTNLNRFRNKKNHSHQNKYTTSIIKQPQTMRHNSLPVGSSSPVDSSRNMITPTTIPQLSASHSDTTDFLSTVNEEDASLRAPFRPRSSVMSSTSSISGLPLGSMKKGNEHPYIAARKASMRKSARRNTKSSTSSVGDQSMSPDLITASCDEILLHLGADDNNGGHSSDRLPNSTIDPGTGDISNNPTHSIDSNISIIDCAEDCLNDDDCHDNRLLDDDDSGDGNEASGAHHSNNQPSTGVYDNNHVFEGGDTLERTFSDALIIPDPFEREPDDLLSPDSNIHDVNNLIV